MNKIYQQINFYLDHYNDNRDVMWIDISKQLQVLTRAGYIAKVYADEGMDDIIIIQYHEQEEELASGICEWLTWDEYEQVLSEREQEVIMNDDLNS